MIVDDEEMVITSMRAFLSLETEYDIHGFTDPEEAAAFYGNASGGCCGERLLDAEDERYPTTRQRRSSFSRKPRVYC